MHALVRTPSTIYWRLIHSVAPHGAREVNDQRPAHRPLFGCLQILENTAFRKLATTRSAAISLVEHRRAHNICIELSGIRMPFDAIKVSKLAFDMITVRQQ